MRELDRWKKLVSLLSTSVVRDRTARNNCYVRRGEEGEGEGRKLKNRGHVAVGSLSRVRTRANERARGGRELVRGLK